MSIQALYGGYSAQQVYGQNFGQNPYNTGYYAGYQPTMDSIFAQPNLMAPQAPSIVVVPYDVNALNTQQSQFVAAPQANTANNSNDKALQMMMTMFTLLFNSVLGSNKNTNDLSEEKVKEKPAVVIEDINGKAWGDPHFNVINSEGKKMEADVKGKDNSTYRIFDAQGGDGITVDAKYVKYKDTNNPQVMGEIRVQAGDRQLQVSQSGKVTLDGEEIEKGKSYTLADGTKFDVHENGNVTVHSKEGDAKLNIKHTDDYLDIDVDGSWSNGTEKVGGVLGVLNQNKDKLSTLGGKKVVDIDGDGVSDDLNKDGFIDDEEWAKLGYNFELTGSDAIK